MKQLATCCAVLGGLAGSVCTAQDEIRQLRATEVIGTYQNAVGTSDAASQGVVTQTLIENRPVLRPAEVMEFVPGLIITQHSGEGKANQYYLRGYNLDHGTDLATWVAGMPINMPTHGHGQGYTDLNFLIPELISRIDYKKGPYYAEEGDFASAGAVRVGLADRLPHTIASGTLGSFDYQRALLAGSPAVAGGNLLYAFEFLRNDGPWKHPDDLQRLNGVLRYSRGGESNRFGVTLMAYDADWDSTDQIAKRAVDSGLIGRFGSLDETDGGKSSRYSLSADWKLTGAKGITDLSAYWIKLNLFSNFTYFAAYPVNGDQFEQQDRRDVLGLNASHTWINEWRKHEMSNRVGLNLRHDDIEGVGLFATRAQQRLSTVREDDVKETAAGIFFENNTRWHDKFRSIAGLRYDRFRFKVDSNIAANSGSKTDAQVSPKLSLIFGPWKKTEYFLNAGYGFHSNDARGTTISVDPVTGDPAGKVDPLVRTKGYELGLRTEALPGLQSSLALWQLKQDSELLFVGDAGSTEASRPSKRTGIEWSNHYIAKPWLFFDVDFNFTRAHFTDNDAAGNRIPGAPNRVITAGITVDNLGAWFGSINVRHFGPRPLIEDNSVQSDSTTLVNLRAGYKINKKFQVSLDLFNLFDKEASNVDYFYESQLAGESAPVEDIHFHPVERRGARLTLTGLF
jgi:outer membrane receptor protein involved in Fe transport